MKDRFRIRTLPYLVAALMLLCHSAAWAENINPNNDGSQWAWGENVGWFNFDPAQGIGVTVGDSNVTGWVWAENIGWINLGPMAYGGVMNDSGGNLSGWGWGENVGWISFSCENTGSCGTVDYGVSIDAQGIFDGWAWGENLGWIHFKSTSPIFYKVQSGWFGSITTTTTTTPDTSTTTTTIPSGPCAAEAIYGENSVETELLRKYRDNVLSKTPEGQEIINTYYKFSPTVTKILEQRPLLKNRAKTFMDSMLPEIRKKMEESSKEQ